MEGLLVAGALSALAAVAALLRQRAEGERKALQRVPAVVRRKVRR